MTSNTSLNQEVSTISDHDLPQAPDTLQSGIASFVPVILIFIVFYFLLIRPQEKRKKAQEDLVAGVKKGEDVITHSGIYGRVAKINDSDSTIDLEIADSVVIKILKTAVSDIVSRKKNIDTNSIDASDQDTTQVKMKKKK